jgi:hypothetical protein
MAQIATMFFVIPVAEMVGSKTVIISVVRVGALESYEKPSVNSRSTSHRHKPFTDKSIRSGILRLITQAVQNGGCDQAASPGMQSPSAGQNSEAVPRNSGTSRL